MGEKSLDLPIMTGRETNLTIERDALRGQVAVLRAALEGLRTDALEFYKRPVSWYLKEIDAALASTSGGDWHSPEEWATVQAKVRDMSDLINDLGEQVVQARLKRASGEKAAEVLRCAVEFHQLDANPSVGGPVERIAWINNWRAARKRVLDAVAAYVAERGGGMAREHRRSVLIAGRTVSWYEQEGGE
jgi:hypothetical protein